jgi:hypothetical protein
LKSVESRHIPANGGPEVKSFAIWKFPYNIGGLPEFNPFEAWLCVPPNLYRRNHQNCRQQRQRHRRWNDAEKLAANEAKLPTIEPAAITNTKRRF